MKRILILAAFSGAIALKAQTGNSGINTTDPKATLDVNLSKDYKSGQLAGIAVPQLTGDQIEAIAPATSIKSGTLVYATAVSTAATKDITGVGYWYWKDATDKWEPIIIGTSIGGNTNGGTGWNIDGNAATTAANYVGTKDAQPLNFKTNATADANPKMTITTDGNVGIGTSSPEHKLDVRGVTLSNNFTIRSHQDNKNHDMWIGTANTLGDGKYWGHIGGNIDATDNIRRLGFFANTNFFLGDVGIGTLTPKQKLHVEGNILANNSEIIYGTNGQNVLTRDNAGLRGDAGARSGFFETNNPTNYPPGATGWWHLLDVRHDTPTNNYALQLSGSFLDQNLWFRKTNDNPAQAWSRLLSTNDTGSFVQNQYTSAQSANFWVSGEGRVGSWFRNSTDGTGLYNEANVAHIYSTPGWWNTSKGFLLRDGFNGAIASQLGVAGNTSYLNAAGGNVGIGTTTPAYKLDVNGDVIAGWHRSRGVTGWYNETYQGGWYMADNVWVRTYGGKNVWTDGLLGSNGGLTVGYGGGAPNTTGGAIIAGHVGIGTYTPAYKLDVVGKGRFSDQTQISIGADPCCGADYTLSLAENTTANNRLAKIQFHNAGAAEGYIALSKDGPRRMILNDNQNVGMGIEVNGDAIVTGKVGIGTATPQVNLDVKAKTTTGPNVEGILIPQVNKQKAQDMGANAPEGTLVYISDVSAGSGIYVDGTVMSTGFYYMKKGTTSKKWVGIANLLSAGADQNTLIYTTNGF